MDHAPDIETQARLATDILQAAYAEMERAGIEVAAASNALINLGAEGLTMLHGSTFAADQLRRHAQTVELYEDAKGEA